MKIARVLRNCIFRLKTLLITKLFIFVVYKISFFNLFEDNYKIMYVIHNNFIKVALSGIVFIFNVLIIFLFEKEDFRRIYNETV